MAASVVCSDVSQKLGFLRWDLVGLKSSLPVGQYVQHCVQGTRGQCTVQEDDSEGTFHRVGQVKEWAGSAASSTVS